MDINTAKAVVVKGAGNKGKTTLIFQLLKDILYDGGEIVAPKHYTKSSIMDKTQASDYAVIIRYKNKNILIMSQGDGVEYLKKQVLFFKNELVVIDLVIGVARTRGKTVWWWQDNFHQRLNFFHNNQEVKESERGEYIRKQLYSLKEMLSKYI